MIGSDDRTRDHSRSPIVIVTTLTRRQHAFGPSVNLHEVEELLLRWSGRSDQEAETTLDVSECRNVDLGAGLRLANAMRRWSAGRLIIIIAAETDLNDSQWFRLFTRSALGDAMASHADSVRAADRDMTDEL